MRKREILRVVRDLEDIAADFDHLVLQQVHAAIWYFGANSDSKGVSWSYAALDSAIDLARKLRRRIHKVFPQWDRRKSKWVPADLLYNDDEYQFARLICTLKNKWKEDKSTEQNLNSVALAMGYDREELDMWFEIAERTVGEIEEQYKDK